MIKKIIITGAAGFAGKALGIQIQKKLPFVEIIGLDIIPSKSSNFKLINIDITNLAKMSKIIEDYEPDVIVHLAGLYGGYPFQEVLNSNILSSSSIHEAVRIVKPDTIIISAGSAAEYGFVSNNEIPVVESIVCKPINSNGLSKLLATEIALNYYNVFGITSMIIRPFQLIGKGISNKLVPGAFYNEIINAKNGNKNKICVGNLESYRDFIDVYDTADAIIKLAQKPLGGEVFNVCSGKPVKILNLLQLMIQKSSSHVDIEIDSLKFKKNQDVSIIYGSYDKIFNHCGWKPTTSLEKSLENMFL